MKLCPYVFLCIFASIFAKASSNLKVRSLSRNGALRAGTRLTSSGFAVGIETGLKYDASQEGRTQNAGVSAAGSCNGFVDIIGRVFYMRDELHKITTSLGTSGYSVGREWVVGHAVGIMTPATMPTIICGILSNRRQGQRSPRASNSTSDAGCPEGSLQEKLLMQVSTSFDGVRQENKSLDAVRSIFEDLLHGFERNVMNFYQLVKCPTIAQSEIKARHVCEVHRHDQARALKMCQGEIPMMRSRVFSLQARIKKIDSGVSRECAMSRTTTVQPSQAADRERCLELHAVTDAILDGRQTQKRWLKAMGDDMQLLGAMSMQIRRRITGLASGSDPSLQNASQLLGAEWDHLESPSQALRALGSFRAKDAGNIDSLLLQLGGFLKTVSGADGCLSENFRLRYSARSCASLRSQLNATLHLREADLKVLEGHAHRTMLASGTGLTDNKCEKPSLTEGCWLRLPTGCPKLPEWKSAHIWTKDAFGEEAAGAGEDAIVCTTTRKLQIDNFCGVQNTETRFIPGIT